MRVFLICKKLIHGFSHLFACRCPGPDVQIGVFCSPADAMLFEGNLNWESPNFWSRQNALNPDTEGFLMVSWMFRTIDCAHCLCKKVPTLLHPRSRGEIRLRSNDPFEHPCIEPNYLDNRGMNDAKSRPKGRVVNIIIEPLFLRLLFHRGCENCNRHAKEVR